MRGTPAHTASTPARGPAAGNLRPSKRQTFTLYKLHLALLSSVNVVVLFLLTLESGMGLWIFGDGNNGTAHWEPDPNNSRGTWAILSTCIITLTLCIYTSLHLNVPAHRSSNTDAFLMKAKYVIFGLLAPELIAFNAWRQRTVALSLVDRIRKERGGEENPSLFRRGYSGIKKIPRKLYQGAKTLPRRLTGKLDKEKYGDVLPFAIDKDPWAEMTLIHGFYIVMGGFTFDVAGDTRLRIWPQGVDRLTPSTVAVSSCLMSKDPDLREVIPFLSEEEIWDKSKANGLAKTIVCIQAAWFCTQCIARLGQGMPISLLELNTFAHAVCALLVYVLWWHKPLDVHEPTAIDVSQSDAARNVCAIAWSGPQAPVPHMHRVSTLDDRRWKRFMNRFGQFIGRFSECHLGDGPLINTIRNSRSTPKCSRFAQIHGLKRPLALVHRPLLFQGLKPEEIHSRTWVSSDPPVFSLDGEERIPSTSLAVSSEWSSIDVDEVLLERLKVVEKLRSQGNYMAYRKAFSCILDTRDPDLCMLKPRELNFTDSLMRQQSDVSPVNRNVAGATGIIISGFLYGGLHMIAWGSTAFNSPLEDLAWKISCFVVAGGGLFMYAGIVGLDAVNKRKKANQRMDIVKGLVYAATPISIAFCGLYLVCRVYLVFEVFRNLAFVDPKVYQTPDWSVYFPHIS